MHENDRSATGYLTQAEFQATADHFFAEPEVSARRWERAVDAQAGIVREAEAVRARHALAEPRGNPAVVKRQIGTLSAVVADC